MKRDGKGECAANARPPWSASVSTRGFDYGYPRKAFRDLGHYCRGRVITQLNRRSQRKYHRPKGMSHYQYLQHLGLFRP